MTLIDLQKGFDIINNEILKIFKILEILKSIKWNA